MALLRNNNTGAIIATRVDRATTFLQRSVGLLARSNVQPDEGLWIDKCSSIHTMGMRSTIDVIFLDADNSVVRLCPNVRRWRLALICLTARSVIELGSGALSEIDVMPGDQLELIRNAAYSRTDFDAVGRRPIPAVPSASCDTFGGRIDGTGASDSATSPIGHKALVVPRHEGAAELAK